MNLGFGLNQFGKATKGSRNRYSR